VNSDITVVPAKAHDVTAVADLVAEIEEYYGGEVDSDQAARISLLNRLLFADSPVAHVLLAQADSTVVGMASYSFLWPAAGDTHSLYMKELFVRQAHRRTGAATALVRRLEEIAGAAGCSRLEWTTDRDNPDAQKFYEALGAAPQDSKIFYRLPPAER
jgi:GNAT superfamily N-acetyltransferase